MTINDTSEYKLNPSNCFSIIFRGDWTVDLMILDEVDRNEILDALDQILHTYQEQKTRVSNDVLLLRYVWLDADKVRRVSSSEARDDKPIGIFLCS